MALNLILKTVLIYGQSFIILPIYSSGSTILVCPAFGLSEPGVIVQNIFCLHMPVRPDVHANKQPMPMPGQTHKYPNRNY